MAKKSKKERQELRQAQILAWRELRQRQRKSVWQRILTNLWRFAMGLILLFVALYLAVLSSPVQNKIVQRVVSTLEEQLGSSVSVGHVAFYPFDALFIHDLFVEDYRQDTLLACAKVEVHIDRLSIAKREAVVSSVLLNEAVINYHLIRRDTVLGTPQVDNLQVWLDALLKDRRRGGTISWEIDFQTILLENSRFTYTELPSRDYPSPIDWGNIACDSLSVRITDFDRTDSGRYSCIIEDLSLREKSGFRLDEISMDFEIVPGYLLGKEAHFRFGESDVLFDSIRFDWELKKKYWVHFVDLMQMDYHFAPSTLQCGDLAYFAPEMKGADAKIKLSGRCFGTVDDFRAENLSLKFGSSSLRFDSLHMTGLPKIRQTELSFDLNKGSVLMADVDRLRFSWFKDGRIPLQPGWKTMAPIDLSADFSGSFSSGELIALCEGASVKGDINLDYDTSRDALSARVDLDSFHLGKWLGMPDFGAVSGLRGHFTGTDMKAAHSSSYDLELQCKGIEVQDNLVSDVTMTGRYRHDVVQFHVTSLDSLLALTLQGGGIVNDEHQSGSYVGSFSGRKLERWLGTALGNDLALSFGIRGTVAREGNDSLRIETVFAQPLIANKRGTTSLENITILADASSSEVGKGLSKLDLSVASSALDCSLSGHYLAVPLSALKESFVSRYVPIWSGTSPSRLASSDFVLDGEIALKSVDSLLMVLYPDVQVTGDANLAWKYHSSNGVKVEGAFDVLRYKDLWIQDFAVNLRDDDCVLSAAEVLYGDNLQILNLADTLHMNHGILSNSLSWDNYLSSGHNRGELLSELFFDREGSMRLHLLPSSLLIKNNPWTVGESWLSLTEQEWLVRDFELFSEAQRVHVTGPIKSGSQDPEELVLSIQSLSIEALNRIFSMVKSPLCGEINGKITAHDLFARPAILGDLRISDFGIAGDTIGQLALTSTWDEATSEMVLALSSKTAEGTAPLAASGRLAPQMHEFSASVQLQDLEASLFKQLLPDAISQLSGSFSGVLDVEGSAGNITPSGYFALNDVSITLSALNTPYFVSDTIFFQESRLLVDGITIRDKVGNPMTLNGYFDVNRELYDFSIAPSNFQILNTTAAQSSRFYGQLFLTGELLLNNLEGMLSVSGDLSPDGHSQIIVPLTAGAYEDKNTFLHFVEEEQPLLLSDRRQAVASASILGDMKVDLALNLSLNDNLGIQVIFDPTIGDILEASGHGNIRLALDRDNKLNLFGDYVIDRGSYLFTLSSFINKKFDLREGGSLSWSGGSPYSAAVNLNAVYSLRTSLEGLLAGTTSTIDKSQKVPVHCILGLSGELTTPEVAFAIDFPSITQMSEQQQLKSLFPSQDDISKQFFSLLMLNSFYSTQEENTDLAAQAGLSTATELISNQLSRWLAQFNQNIDVGISYRLGDAVTTDELGISASMQLLNNRVTISANGNVVEREKTSGDSPITGDFDMDVKLNSTGSLRMKVYSHMDERITYQSTETVQGLGFSYQENFDTLGELMRRYFPFLYKKEEE